MLYIIHKKLDHSLASSSTAINDFQFFIFLPMKEKIPLGFAEGLRRETGHSEVKWKEICGAARSRSASSAP